MCCIRFIYFTVMIIKGEEHMNEIKITNVGGVWNTHPHWPSLAWGTGIDAAVKRLELIAEDYTFTFRTVEQRWEYNKPYGP